MKDRIKLALAQISSKRENKEANIQKITEYSQKAKNQAANLVIFPEMSLTGYVVRDQLFELAENIPGPSTKRIIQIAKDNDVHIIFGMPELSEKTKATIFNTSVFVSPNGIVGRYRKTYLPTHSVFEEKRYFRPGYQCPAFETSIGSVGLCICYDLFFPEVTRLIRLHGAQLIVCISASPAVRRSYFEILLAARALENTAYLAYVNLAGVEDGLQFWGGSQLVGPTGDVLAKAKYDEEDLIICEVNFNDIRSAETFIPTLKDLRPELYDDLKRSAEEI
jgi:predicted amidohydrolase